MTARFYSQTSNLTVVEIDARVRLLDWTVMEQAEEGATAMSSLLVDDPDMDWEIDGHHSIWVVEDASESSNHVLWHGFTADQEIGREIGDREFPLGRGWSVSLVDRNSLWQRRVMVGSDCNRPAETDVERVTWFLGTVETNYIDNGDLTYVSSDDPVDMDACDYRGQMASQVIDDCAQASGKNWFTWMEGPDVASFNSHAWYGKDDLAVYDSLLYLSNDPDDWTDAELEAGTSLVWPISMDTKLRRDPSRVYNGAYVTYDGGAVYREGAGLLHRDFIAPSLNVKSAAKATARAIRYIADLADQDETITTAVELPAGKATMIRAGMRVQFRATHLPGYDTAETFRWCRVLSCSVSPIAHGDRYRLTLELAPTGDEATLAPTVRWASRSMFNGWDNTSLEASDNGTDWLEVRTAEEVVAGVGNPPGGEDHPYSGLVEIPEEHWRHRYWRMKIVKDFVPFQYNAGTSIYELALLSEGSPDAVCRLGTLWEGGMALWWHRTAPIGGVAYVAHVDSPNWNWELLGGRDGGVCSGTGRGMDYSADQSCPFGVGATVTMDTGTAVFTWTYDLMGS